MGIYRRSHAVSARWGGKALFFCHGAFSASGASVGSSDKLETLPPGSYTMGATEFDKDSDGRVSVCLNSDDTNTAWELLKKYPDAELVLNDYRGFNGRDLDFLRDHTDVKHLRIACGHIRKQGLSALRALESLTVNEWNRDVDIEAFPQLRSFRGDCPERMPERMDALRRTASFVPRARPIPMIGPISGEMSIAPIITAVELTFRPTEAIMTEKARIQTLGPLNHMLLFILIAASPVSIWSLMDTTSFSLLFK